MVADREYTEIAIHGRGGQGVKTSGDLLVHSLFAEGYRVNGQPLYGGERMGAPVMYFLRLNRSGRPIDDRSLVRRPQIMLIFDSSLLRTSPGLIANLESGGLLLLNTRKSPPELDGLGPYRVVPLPASQIAKDSGLVRGNVPIVSPVMVGAFARVTGFITLPTLEKAVAKLAAEMPPDRLEGNLVGMRRGYEAVAPLAGVAAHGEGG
jgi:2-oxoacid:acceptor oxidoreductase gamma subunit (pyruvate/2-ketoisovalerate family)